MVINIKNERKEEERKVSLMTPEERQKYIEEKPEHRMRRETIVRGIDYATEKKRLQAVMANMTPEERQKHLEEKQVKLVKANQTKILEAQYGIANTEMICPHCQQKGKIHTKFVNLKKGVSGAKATGAILTGGLSLLAIGLSRKENTTQAHCVNCSSTWYF
jgi:hypothetical protein